MRILLADDHPLFRAALSGIVRGALPGCEVDEAENYADTRAKIAARSPDLVLLDLMMPGNTGLAGLVELVNLAEPKARIVAISGLESPQVIRQVRACGLAGFIVKTSRPEHIANTLQMVLRGGSVFPDTPDHPAAEPAHNGTPLTPKQLQVLELLTRGMANKAIAKELALSPNTIKVHVTEILRKLGVSSRSEAIAMTKAGWHPEDELG